jgi:hypothetical protein
MTLAAEPTRTAPSDEADEAAADGERAADAAPSSPDSPIPFIAWGVAAYAFTLAAILVAALSMSDGRMVYVLDDPAIHLSMADTLAHHGTWGVVAGDFQSASSAPLWTLLLAGWVRLVPGPASVAPLVLNVVAGVATIAILGSSQRLLRPSWRRPLDVVAVVALVTIVLFLPALTMVGMEHTLHGALVLGAVVAFHRRAGPAWLPYALVALAAGVRFETIFIAVGVAVALLVTTSGRRWIAALAAVAAGVLPVAAFGLVNLSMGQGLLPNSVLAKSSLNGAAGESLFREVTGRITEDPLVAALLAVLIFALVAAREPGRGTWPSWSFPAIVYVVATVLHIGLARMGWYDRYQAYLIAVGVYALLELAADAVSRDGAPVRLERGRLGFALVLVLLVFTWTKVSLTMDVADAVEETYQQRYQAGLFFERYYDGRPIATGELGYVTLFHDGDITDLFGLGDHDVLEQRRRSGNHPPPDYWAHLAEERGFEVVGAYPTTLFFETPPNWVRVGTWQIDADVVTAWEPDFTFWATRPEAVAELDAHLRDFEPSMPDGVTLQMNEFATMQAAQIAESTTGTP